MKRIPLKLAALILLLAGSLAFGHEGVELGPNGGRILDFSKDETMHGELTVKGGKFQVGLLDKEMKPVSIKDQVLTVTSGDRSNPEKLTVEKQGNQFVLPAVKEGQWAIFQFRENATAKPITARVEYNTETCEKCSKAEWLCTCKAEDEQKK